MLQSILLSSLLVVLLQRQKGAITKQNAKGAYAAILQILLGSQVYLSQIAAGMNSTPATITKKACQRAVPVVILAREEMFQRLTVQRLFCFIRERRDFIQRGPMFLFLKLYNNYASTINQLLQTFNYPTKLIFTIFLGFITTIIFIMDSQPSAPSFKVILIGDSSTGKTSLIRKYIHGAFKDEYEVTVGVDFSSKTVVIDNQPVQLQIWDTCGQDVYKAITSNFYRGAAAVFLVYSVNNRESFNSLTQWLSDFQERGSKEAFIFLIGAKCDLDSQVQPEEAFQLLKTVKGAFFIQTSAKGNLKVDELFYKAAQTMYKCYQISRQYRNLVKPERVTFLPQHSLPQSHLAQRLSVDNLNQNKTQEKRKCCA